MYQAVQEECLAMKMKALQSFRMSGTPCPVTVIFRRTEYSHCICV